MDKLKIGDCVEYVDGIDEIGFVTHPIFATTPCPGPGMVWVSWGGGVRTWTPIENLRRVSTTNPALLNDFVICRSDSGDGGWSLHAPGSTDDDIARGESPAILSGPAKFVDGKWTRPNKKDYEKAEELLLK